MSAELSRLDPNTTADAAVIRETLQSAREFGPDVMALARTVVRDADDPLLRADGLNALASAAVLRHEAAEAGRLFREALATLWGTGTHAERTACINLAMIAGQQHRLVEGVVLARRACQVALEMGESSAICLAHAEQARVLCEIGDIDGFQEALVVADRHVPDVDERFRDWLPQVLGSMHAELASRRGDDGVLTNYLAELELSEQSESSKSVSLCRAGILKRLGRTLEARDVAREALARDRREDSLTLRLEAEELECLVELDDRPGIRRLASCCLGRLSSPDAGQLPTAWRMRVANMVGEQLARYDDAQADAGEAFKLAAAAALERSWEAERFFDGFPQIEQVDETDLVALEGYRTRFKKEHRKLLEAITRLVSDGRNGEACFRAPSSEGLLVCICAWCKHVRGPERVWIPLDDYSAPAGDLEVTHGMCESCYIGTALGSGR